MSKCTSTISEMWDDVSTNTASATMKKKYVAARSMSKSMVTRTQLLSRSTPATLQTMALANPEGPPAFTRALRTLQWPRGFKITRVEPYEGRMM